MEQNKQQHILAYDLSNLAYIAAHGLEKGFELRPDGADQLREQIEQYARYLYRQLVSDKVIFACDSHTYWRRDIYPEYKGHREETELKRCVRDAIHLFKSEKANVCCEVEGAEADDVMYALSTFDSVRLTIVSMDGDFQQLLGKSVRLYNPRQKRFEKATPNVKFDLFVKCFRGDRSDNIPSAYPRISRKRLWQAYNFEHEKTRVLGTELTPGERVEKQFVLNQTLIDLSQLPSALLAQLQSQLKQKLSF